MTEERIIVAYKVEVVVSKENGFREKERADIRKIAEKQIAEAEKKTWRYLRDNLVFLQIELSVDFKWSEEEIGKIRIEDIKVEQILPEVNK